MSRQPGCACLLACIATRASHSLRHRLQKNSWVVGGSLSASRAQAMHENDIHIHIFPITGDASEDFEGKFVPKRGA